MSAVDAAGPDLPPEPLGEVCVPRGVVHPVHRSDNPHRQHYGVLRDDGTLVGSTVDDRHHGEHLFIPPDPGRFDAIDELAREAVYAGPKYDIYGHFLLESCQRLWWAVDRPELPIVWTADEGVSPELNRWQRDILDVLGVRNEVVVVTRPTRVERLHVPDAGYKYADWSHPQQIDFLAAHAGPPQQNGAKLWLSRDPAHGRGLINRHIVERRLRELGWTVVTFEQMPVRDQLDALARAEIVAGEEASTFHNLLLLQDVTGKQFQIFRRHGPEHLSFTTIGDARAVNQRFHSCSQDAVLSAKGRGVVRLAPNAAQYLSHLGIPIPAPAPGPPASDPVVRTLTRLAGVTGARTYLQLGSGHDLTFTSVGVESCDVVGEQLDFDVRSYRDRGARFYEVTLEQFLTWFAEGRTYDLVLLDDRHGRRDAVDRILAVFDRAAHDRTVVVLNAVVDADLVAFTLRYLHPELGSRVVGTAHRQLVIWRRDPAVTRRVRPRRFAGRDATADLLFPRRDGRARLVDTLRSIGLTRTRLTRLVRWIRSRPGS